MSDRQVAGIAVGYDSVVVTLVSGTRSAPQYADPVEHKLQALTPEEVASAVSGIVSGVGATTSVSLSIPDALAWHGKQRYEDAIKSVLGEPYIGAIQARRNIWGITVHSTSCFKNYANDFPVDEPVNVLFLDLTPSHASAGISSVETDDGVVYFTGGGRYEKTILETPLENLSPQDLIDNLITPTTDQNPTDLHGIYIFRPDGSSAALSSAVHYKFPDTPIKWVSLSDISHGTAVAAVQQNLGEPMNCELAFTTLPVPIQIALSDRQLVPAVPRNRILPFKHTVMLTTSRHNQTTATVQLLQGVKPFGTVTVDELPPRPKGEVQILVSVEMDHVGETVVCVQPVGSSEKTVKQLGNVFDAITNEEIEAYLAEHYSYDESSERLHSCNDREDVLGDLPA
ncbi:hypothetical protein M758_3G160200 [Ceratodon purpureus]|nr:hypothetical protein M758_3G160200 [Ceratodon purpureus]